MWSHQQMWKQINPSVPWFGIHCSVGRKFHPDILQPLPVHKCLNKWESRTCLTNQVSGVNVTHILYTQAFCSALILFSILSDAFATRICDSSGSWIKGNWTNYTQCLPFLETPVSFLFLPSLSSLIAALLWIIKESSSTWSSVIVQSARIDLFPSSYRAAIVWFFFPFG